MMRSMISDEGVAGERLGIVAGSVEREESPTGGERLVDANAGCGMIGGHRSGDVPPEFGELDLLKQGNTLFVR